MPSSKPVVRSLNSRLKMKHLELFRNVCEKQTLHSAAQASSMTQPAATKLIRELEDMLAVQLFERGRRGMRLTHYGVVLQRHVSILMADLAVMQHEIALVAQGAVGQLRLGVIPSLSSELVSAAIAGTLKDYPGVRFSIEEGPTTDLLARLTRNDLDLTFGRVLDLSVVRELRVVKVYDESFAIVARANHPLSRKRGMDWKRLGEATWALPASGTPMRNLVDNLFTRNSILRPLVAVEYSTFEKMRRLIARTEILGVLPRSMAMLGEAAGELSIIRRDVDVNFAPISLIFRKQFDAPPVMHHFEQTVHAMARSLKLT